MSERHRLFERFKYSTIEMVAPNFQDFVRESADAEGELTLPGD